MPPRPLQKDRRAGLSAGPAGGPLYKVRQLSERVLQAPGDIRLSLCEIEGATDDASEWSRKADDSDGGKTAGLWTAVGEGGLAALHALYALVLRRSCSQQFGEAERAAYAALRTRLTYELSNIALDEAVHMTAGRARAVMHCALRTHVLRCMAVVLADAALPLSPLRQQSMRPSTRSIKVASDALEEVRVVLLCIGELLSSDEEGADDIVSEDAFSATLAKELHASQLLEHWSRLLLLLVATATGDRLEHTAIHLHLLAEPLLNLEYFLGAAWQHKMLLASPSLSYLLSSHVVGLCAALDGGPTYGMPAAAAPSDEDDGAAPAVAPLFEPTGRRLRRKSPEGAGTKLAQWALAVWSDTIVRERTLEGRDCDFICKRPYGGDELAPRPSLATTMSLRPLYRWKQSCADSYLGRPQPPATSSSVPSRAEACGSAASTSDGSTAYPAESASPRDYPGRKSPAHTKGVKEMTTRGKQARQRMQLAAALPLHTGATFEVCMRLVAAATKAIAADAASAPSAPTRGRVAHGSAAAADTATSSASASGNREQGLLVAAEEAPELAVRALQCGWHALGVNVVAAEVLPPALEARLRRWWAALGELGRVAAGRGSVNWQHLTEMLAVVAPDGVHGLPSRPTPCVAAALDAGYTRHLTSILLEASRENKGAWNNLLRPPSHRKWAWDQLLTFGPPKETRLLVTAIAGLLRRSAAAVPELVSPGRPAAAVDGTMLVGTLKGLLSVHEVHHQSLQNRFALVLEAKTADKGAVAAGAGAASDTGCDMRQAEMLVCISRSLLPDFVAVLLRRFIPATIAAGFVIYRLRSLFVMPPLFVWLAILAAVQAHAAEQAALPGSSSRAAAAVVAWRQLLVEGMRLPELLGTAAGLVAGGREGNCYTGAFSWMLTCMARLVPGELAAALASQEAAQAAERVFEQGTAETPAAAGGVEQPQEPSSALRLGLVRLLGPGGLRPCEDLLRVLLRVLSGDGGLEEATTLEAPVVNWEQLMSLARLMVAAG